MKNWMQSILNTVQKEKELFKNARTFSDGLKILLRLGIFVFLLAFKWIVPVAIVAIVRLFTH